MQLRDRGILKEPLFEDYTILASFVKPTSLDEALEFK